MGHRIQSRRSNGRFRRITLADIGMACCPKCGAIYTFDLSQFNGQRFIDPRELNRAMATCPVCDGGTNVATGMVADGGAS